MVRECRASDGRHFRRDDMDGSEAARVELSRRQRDASEKQAGDDSGVNSARTKASGRRRHKGDDFVSQIDARRRRCRHETPKVNSVTM